VTQIIFKKLSYVNIILRYINMSSIESLKHTTLFAVGCRRDLEKSIQNTQGKDYGKSHTYYKFCYSR